MISNSSPLTTANAGPVSADHKVCRNTSGRRTRQEIYQSMPKYKARKKACRNTLEAKVYHKAYDKAYREAHCCQPEYIRKCMQKRFRLQQADRQYSMIRAMQVLHDMVAVAV